MASLNILFNIFLSKDRIPLPNFHRQVILHFEKILRLLHLCEYQMFIYRDE